MKTTGSVQKKTPKIDHLRELKDVFLKFLSDEDVKIILFGSRARGDFVKTSDVDVGIIPGKMSTKKGAAGGRLGMLEGMAGGGGQRFGPPIKLEDWETMGGGDGMYNVFDRKTNRYLYNESQFGPLQRIAYGMLPGTSADARAKLERLHALYQQTAIDCTLAADIMLELWEKFVLLTTLAAMNCLMRGAVGDIMATDEGAALVTETLDACARTAAAAGHAPREKALAAYRKLLLERGLLEIEDREVLWGHPIYGASWEGFVIENICSELGRWSLSFFKTAAGAEIDLVLSQKAKDGLPWNAKPPPRRR